MSEILHFGPGNFFRAHLAEYTFDAGGWSITAVSLRSSAIRDGLARQSNRYTLAVHGGAEKQIDVISDVLVAQSNPQKVLDLIQSPRFPVITATVTEKGYHLRPDGELNMDDPDIVHDLKSIKPRTLIGFLGYGLAHRETAVTVLSCDNRLNNGNSLVNAVTKFQEAAGLGFGCAATFPNAMVDRITPAATADLAARTNDPMAVACEPFKEWVIEDRFSAQRPDWPGVQFVTNVTPHEKRKLRMLNGAHSYLAYAGLLKGYTFVHEAIADAQLRTSTRSLMQEAGMTLPPEVQSQVGSYTEALIARFDNKDVNHRLSQIAMDGSEKVPYRLLDSLRDTRKIGKNAPAIAEAIKAWIRFACAETNAGRSLDDPRAEALAKAAQSDNPTLNILSLIGADDLTSLLLEQ